MSEDFQVLKDFGGVARLFPLPNLVFFPHVIQPLHIFEPRYRRMTADALADDRLIALVMLQDSAADPLKGRPAIHSVACLGRIVADQRLKDGRFNLLIRGLSRVHITYELATKKSYRSAEVELLEDQPPRNDKSEGRMRRKLSKHMAAWFPNQKPVLEQFAKLAESDLSLSALCDIFCYALPLDLQFKQKMLEELCVTDRAKALIQFMSSNTIMVESPEKSRTFPPPFSKN
jgi:uncharacterized protein